MANDVDDILKGKYTSEGLESVKTLANKLVTFYDISEGFDLDTFERFGEGIEQAFEDTVKEFSNEDYAAALDDAMRSIAAGGNSNRLQSFLYGIDRYQKTMVHPNIEHVGLTFMTRPRLNLQSVSIDQDRRFAPLKAPPNSVGHAIRCYLDTKYSDSVHGASASKLINGRCAWFTPLMNSLVGISGFPDPVLQTATTNSGFFSEDQTFALGYDELNKTYDLSLTFKDPQNGPIATLFYYWILYMANLTRGIQTAYMDDITYQRLNYTVSIYRFRLDPTRKYITGYAKATGCFPKSVPIGAMFNFGEGELIASSVDKFTIPFVANKIEYNDYAIIQDFNMLARRYWPGINKHTDSGALEDVVEVGNSASTNFSGLPYISTATEEVKVLNAAGDKFETVRFPGGRPRLAFRLPSTWSQNILEV